MWGSRNGAALGSRSRFGDGREFNEIRDGRRHYSPSWVLGADCWYAVRISGGMLDKIKYIVAYQSQPVSAITHYAPVDRIEPYGEGSKYKLVFSLKAKAITPIPYGDALSGAMQGPRYTTFAQLIAAKKLTDLIGRA